MEILAIFLLIAVTVLGFLCLVVLEYQNRRTKQWQNVKPSMPMPPAIRPPMRPPIPSPTIPKAKPSRQKTISAM